MNKKSFKEEISSLPGSYRMSVDTILRLVEEAMELGIYSFMMFPKIPDSKKDKVGKYSYDKKNFYLKAASAIKGRFPEICLISDVALDPYSSDGHDGIVRSGKIVNDETLKVLSKMSVAQADAGFDMIGPSDMMDGRVDAIRTALDHNGFADTSIMSYTAKYASAFYGPFRDALDSAPVKKKNIPSDKKTYQMDPSNAREALIEAELDTLEGADFLMVKPALHYMDIIQRIKANFDLPVVSYHVSGECAMLKAAALNGWLDFDKAMPETLQGIHRAGSDVIITYFAMDYARLYHKGLAYS